MSILTRLSTHCATTTVRTYAKRGDAIPVPDLTKVQSDAYARFLQLDKGPHERDPQIGLEALLREVYPIESYDGTMQLEYVYYVLEEPRYTPDECRELRLTYGYPFRVCVKLVRQNQPDIAQEEIYLGEFPVMQGGGEFIVNGAERVIVNQLHRSPGVDFSIASTEADRPLHSARVIPERGSWIELEVTKKDVLVMRIDQSTKLAATTFLRCLDESVASTDAVLSLFYEISEIKAADARPDHWAAQGVFDPETGEEIVAVGRQLGDAAERIAASSLKKIRVIQNPSDTLILNTVAEEKLEQLEASSDYERALLKVYTKLRPGNPPQVEKAKQLFFEKFYDDNRYRLGKVGRFRINRKFNLNTPEDVMFIRAEDFLRVVQYMLDLRSKRPDPKTGRPAAQVDDIDHLGNRRLRTLDELAVEELRKGFLKLRRTVQERMSVKDPAELAKVADLVNSKSISSAIDFFFGRSELSQVVDQTNPLSSLIHERRLSALGPGGLNRKRAGFEVRDVHISHYGRICPIETPEDIAPKPIVGVSAALIPFLEHDDANLALMGSSTQRIHIDAFDVEVRETKLGREEFTRDIPNVSEKMLRNLDENGVIRLGARVGPGDILVGKVSPKSKSELTPEEKLLHAIFGRAGEDVKNDSLEVPAGVEGIVIGARRFSRRMHLNAEQKKRLQKEIDDYGVEMDRKAVTLFKQMVGQINEVVGTEMVDPSTRQKVAASDIPEVVLEQIENFDLKWIKGSKEAREKAELLYRQFWPRVQANRKEKERKIGHMKRGDELPTGVLEMVKVYLATKRQLSVGDKMAGRHGNKGVIARIVPEEVRPGTRWLRGSLNGWRMLTPPPSEYAPATGRGWGLGRSVDSLVTWIKDRLEIASDGKDATLGKYECLASYLRSIDREWLKAIARAQVAREEACKCHGAKATFGRPFAATVEIPTPDESLIAPSNPVDNAFLSYLSTTCKEEVDRLQVFERACHVLGDCLLFRHDYVHHYQCFSALLSRHHATVIVEDCKPLRACVLSTPTRRVIYVDPSLSPRGREFATLHELGHIALDHEPYSSFLGAEPVDAAARDRYAHQEREADAMAWSWLSLFDTIDAASSPPSETDVVAKSTAPAPTSFHNVELKPLPEGDPASCQ